METEYKALAKVAALLRDGRRAIEADLTPAEVAAIKQYQLLTLKPVIYVLNVDESGFEVERYAEEIRSSLEAAPVIALCAQVEAELVDLDEESRKEFMDELGLKESGLQKLIRETFNLLGLATFSRRPARRKFGPGYSGAE